jgi:hypothetical protein
MAFSAAVVALPAVALADAAQLFDIWNLSASEIKVYAYDPTPKNVTRQDPSLLPAVGTTVSPGRNLQLKINPGAGAVVRLNSAKNV